MTMKQDDISRAIKLSLIHRSDEEEQQLHNEVENILKFIKVIQTMQGTQPQQSLRRTNVFRSDRVTVSGGVWREKILNQAPITIKNWIATKKIL